jgi:hypothetical protein
MIQARLLRFASASLLTLGLAFAASPAGAQVAEAEPNSTCLSAQNLGSAALPLSVSGDLTTPPAAPDVDYYRIDATPGDRIVIRQRGTASNAGTLQDPYLGVFTSTCSLLEYADYDSGNWLDAKVEMSVPADGVVVIAASSAYDWQFLGNGNGDGRR